MSGIERLHLEDAYEDCPQVNANIFKTFLYKFRSKFVIHVDNIFSCINEINRFAYWSNYYVSSVDAKLGWSFSKGCRHGCSVRLKIAQVLFSHSQSSSNLKHCSIGFLRLFSNVSFFLPCRKRWQMPLVRCHHYCLSTNINDFLSSRKTAFLTTQWSNFLYF